MAPLVSTLYFWQTPAMTVCAVLRTSSLMTVLLGTSDDMPSIMGQIEDEYSRNSPTLQHYNTLTLQIIRGGQTEVTDIAYLHVGVETPTAPLYIGFTYGTASL